MADIKYLDKTGLGTVKSILEGLFSPKGHKHTVADITNFPSSLPASDVYSWAKAKTKPAYSFSEINPGNATIGDGANSLFLRTNGSWASSIYHHTSSDEAVVFLNKGKNVNNTANYTTSWIFAYGTPADRPAWTSLTPVMQIKGESVVINKLLGSTVGASYNLDVNGSANATTLYENGTRVALSGHNHDARYYTEGEIDTKLAGKANTVHGHSGIGDGALVHMCSLQAKETYNAYKIITNWNKASNYMPTINIRGYAYGSQKTIDCDIVMYHYNSEPCNYSITNKGSYDIKVYSAIENNVQVFYIEPGEYFGMFNVFVYGGMGTENLSGWTMETASAVSGTELPKNAIATNVTGNAGSATKLETARVLTIGNSGKAFNGQSNISWTLTEIGAAAAHSHPYLPLAGGTMNSDANISWEDRGAWNNASATYPYSYGGLYWKGTSDWIKLYGKEEDSDKLNLFIEFGDDTGHDIKVIDNGGTPKTVCYTGHTHNKSQITDFPSSLPANGGNADTVGGKGVSDFARFYLSPMSSGAPADSAKSWFTDTMPSGSGAIVYNVPGAEKTIIAGKSSGAFGHMLQLNYDDNYLRILRYYSGSWKTTDWEKISAGYADTAGSAVDQTARNTANSKWTYNEDTIKAVKVNNASNADKLDNIDSTGFLQNYSQNYGSTISTATDISPTLTSGVAQVHISNIEYSSVLTGYDFNNKAWQLRFRPSYNDGIYFRSQGTGTTWQKLAFSSDIPTSLPANGGSSTYAARLGDSSSYYTKSSLDTALSGKAASSHSHSELTIESISDPSLAYSDQKLKYYLIGSTNSGTAGYAGKNYGFPVSHNANSILWLGNHSGNYGGQLGISGNGYLYYRCITNGSFPTDANGASWNRIAYKSEIPTSLPANGGNADTVGGKSASDFAAASHGTHITSDAQTWAGEKTHSSRSIFTGGGAGSSSISYANAAMTIGTVNRSGTAGDYYPGIAFNHMYTYNSGASYRNHAHAWIGLKLHSTPSAELSYLVFATNNDSNNGTSPKERMSIAPDGTVNIINNLTVDGTITAGGVKGNSTSNNLEFRHLDGQNCNGDYNLYLQYHQSSAKTYFNGATYYINGSYYNGTAENANNAANVAWTGITGKPSTFPATRKILELSPSGTETGWYRCIYINSSNATYAQTLIVSIQTSYYSPQNEHYIFAITCGYNGDVDINQLTGVRGGGLVNKVRVVWNNSGDCYFDFYKNSSGVASYKNTFRIEILSGDGTLQSGSLVSSAGGNVVEFTPIKGIKSLNGFYNNSGVSVSYEGHTHDKPSYSFGEIGAGVATIGDGSNRIMFRTNASYKNGIYYSTPGDEALVFGTVNPVTSWIFATTDPTSQTAWTSLTPSLQIKNGKVAINKLIASGVEATYNLEVNGNINASNGFFDTSDERLKDFYDDIDVDFDKLKSIPKKYFSWKDDENKEIHLGTSAQEIQKVYPEIVNESATGELSVDYSKLSVVALAAVDKLYDKINRIEQALIDKGIL